MEVPREFYDKRSRELVRFLQGRVQDTTRFYSLLRGGTSVVVQADKLHVPDHSDGLEIIQNNLHQIDFGADAPGWCYLVKLRDGRWKISQKYRPLKRVTCPPWAPLVCHRDIEYLEYLGLEYWCARWRGQDVDIRLVWTDDDICFLDREMRAYRRLQGANLTYEVLAHVTDDDGNIIGTVTEPMQGRPVELKDRGVVCSAMKRLNEMGLMYEKPELSNILITEGNDVRLLQVYNVFPIPEDTQLAQRKVNLCWSVLRVSVFRALERGMGCCFAPHHFTWQIHVLVPLSDPEKILRGSAEWYVLREVNKYVAGNPVLLKLKKSRGRKRPAWELGEDEGEEENYPRPTKRNCRVILAPEGPPLYTPALPPPSDFDDLPHIPKPIRKARAEDRYVAIVVPPPKRSRAESSYAWIHDAPWMDPSGGSRFEVID